MQGDPAGGAGGAIQDRETLRGPFLYPLVRAVSRKWTGTLDTHTDAGLRHLVYFRDGCPAKVHTGELVAPLDVVLLRMEGVIDPDVLAQAVTVACEHQDVLLGQYLLQHQLIDNDTLAAALRWQILDKLRYLLGDGTARSQHTYYSNTDLIQWPGNPELHPADPLFCMMEAARLESCKPIVARYIPRVLAMRMTLKAEVDKRRFGLSDEESGVVAMLAAGSRTVQQIVDAGLPADVVYPVIFALGVTESLSGRAAPAPPFSIPAPPPSLRSNVPPPVGPPAPGTPVARVKPISIRAPSGGDVRSSYPSDPLDGVARDMRSEPPDSSRGLADSQRPMAADPFGDSGMAKRPSYNSGSYERDQPAGRSSSAPSMSSPPLETEDGASRGEEEALGAAGDDAFAPLGEAPVEPASLEEASQGATKLPVASFAGWPAHKAYEEAERSLRFLEYSRADKAIAQALKEDPGNPEYKALRAWIHAQLAGPVRGLNAYEPQLHALGDIVRKSPNVSTAYYFRGRLLKKLGRHDEAAPDFEMASILDPTNVDAARELEEYERRIKTRRKDEGDESPTMEKILKWFGR